MLAGVGLTPRRMAAYVSDRELQLDKSGSFAFVLAGEEPSVLELDGGTWVAVPEDSFGVLVREYMADRDGEQPAELVIEPLDPPALPLAPTDAALAEQFTAMAWTRRSVWLSSSNPPTPATGALRSKTSGTNASIRVVGVAT